MAAQFKYGMIQFDDHCYARVMLEEVLKAGLPKPAIIIQERSPTAVKRCGWYKRILGNAGRTPPTIVELLEMYKVEGEEETKLVYVDGMNGPEAIAAVREAGLDALVLGGAAIMKEEVFATPRHGTINVHPGYLPYIRGSLPVAWSLVKGELVGCTCHKVSDVLDGGDWIYRDAIEVRKGMSFDEIVYQSCALAGVQVSRVLADLIEKDAVVATPFPPNSAGPNFKWSSKVTSMARAVLEEGTYPHLRVDDAEKAAAEAALNAASGEDDAKKEEEPEEEEEEAKQPLQQQHFGKAAGGAAAAEAEGEKFEMEAKDLEVKA